MTYDSELAETASLRNPAALRRLWGHLGPYRVRMAWLLAGLVLTVGIDVLQPWIIKQFVDDALAGWVAGSVKWVWLYALTAIAASALSAVTGYLALGTCQRLMADMRSRLYARFQNLPLAFFDRTPAGKVLARMVNDPDHIGEPLAQGLILFFGRTILMVATATVMFVLNWRLALAAMAFLPLAVIAAFFFRPYFLRAYRWCRETVSLLNVRMEEQISGHNTVAILGQEQRAAAELDEANERHRAAWVKVMYMHVFYTPLLHMTFGLGNAVLLWYGGVLFLRGAATPGELLAFGIYLNNLSWPLIEMVEQIQGLQSAMAALERVFKFLDTPQLDRPASASPPAAPWGAQRPRGEIEFRDVWFAYRENEWVLKGLSFHVRPGERVALVGPTGSGKTSILSLASVLYRPQKGQILIDGADIAALDPREVRRQVATVIQDVFLFAESIEENVRLWEAGFDRPRVEEASRRAHAHEFVARLNDGYGQKLGERAQTLSVGQRQLISFARALCFDPPVLFLDEATSSVDAQTEELIRQGLAAITSGRTSIIVAHRYSTLAGADRVLVLADGRIVEEGPPADILRRRVP